jgi:glycosyltransferase involved in cell wall biosynthesis
MRLLLLLFLTAAAAWTTVATADAAAAYTWEARGCFTDKLHPWDRSLPLSYKDDKLLTTAACVGFCAAGGFRFVGTQYGRECWCSDEMPPAERVTTADRCAMPCDGDAKDTCGGASTLSVYETTSPLAAPDATEAARPLLALVMMLKDEAHTIKTTLDSVKEGIDRWYVLDTGSTDGTQDVVRKELSGLEGELFTGAFTDYGGTRNKIIDLAGETKPRPVFFLMLSADETVEDIAHIRKHLQRVRRSSGSMHGAYPVTINSGMDFETARLGRYDSDWRYTGRVHEYLTTPDKRGAELWKPSPPFRVQFAATDGERRIEQQKNLLRLIWMDVNDAPDAQSAARHYMLLATTFPATGNFTGPLWAYEQMARVSNWNEEVYHALLMKARTCVSLKMPFEQCHEMFMRAHTYFPQRIDTIFDLAEHYYNTNDFQRAYLYALRLQHMQMPDNLELIQNVLLRAPGELYRWEGMRLLGFASKDMKPPDYEMCVRAFRRMFAQAPERVESDGIAKARMDECEKELTAEQKETLAAEALLLAPPGAAAAAKTLTHPKRAKTKKKAQSVSAKKVKPKETAADVARLQKIEDRRFELAVTQRLTKRVQREESRLKRERAERAEQRGKLRDEQRKQREADEAAGGDDGDGNYGDDGVGGGGGGGGAGGDFVIAAAEPGAVPTIGHEDTSVADGGVATFHPWLFFRVTLLGFSVCCCLSAGLLAFAYAAYKRCCAKQHKSARFQK